MKSSDPLLLTGGTLRCRMYPAGKVTISRHQDTPGFNYQYALINYLAEELVESLSLSSAGSVLEVTNASSGVLLLVACCCSIMEDLIEVKRLKTDDVETGGGVLCKKNYRIIMSTNARY